MNKMTFVPALNNFVTNLKAQRWNYLAMFGLLLLLSLILIYQTFLSVYEIGALIASSQQQIKKIDNLHTTIKTQSATTTTTAVSDWHLFGDAPVILNVNSNYSLVGIEYSPDAPNQGKVYLSTNNGEPVIYNVGEKLPDGVIIQSITENEVTLLRDGTKQTLSMVWDGTGVSALPQGPPPTNLNTGGQIPRFPSNVQNFQQMQGQNRWQMPQ